MSFYNEEIVVACSPCRKVRPSPPRPSPPPSLFGLYWGLVRLFCLSCFSAALTTALAPAPPVFPEPATCLVHRTTPASLGPVCATLPFSLEWKG